MSIESPKNNSPIENVTNQSPEGWFGIEDTNYKATVELIDRLGRPANMAFAQLGNGWINFDEKLAKIDTELRNIQQGKYGYVPDIYFETTKNTTDENGKFESGESFSFSTRSVEQIGKTSYVLRGYVTVNNKMGGPVAPDRKAGQEEKSACAEIRIDSSTGKLDSIKEIDPESNGLRASY